MKADVRISIKDYSRNKNLIIQLVRVPFSSPRQFWARKNGQPWPKDGRPDGAGEWGGAGGYKDFAPDVALIICRFGCQWFLVEYFFEQVPEFFWSGILGQ